MICEKELRHELKRLPKLRNEAVSIGDYEEAARITQVADTLVWILEDQCECKK